MPIDATIALGAKAPDTTQQLSSLLTVAKGAQDVQAGGISLNERKAVSQVLADPSSYTDQEGNIDFTRAMPKIMQVAPTTGMKYVQDLMTAQKSHTEAQQSLNNLTTDVRAQAGKVLYGLPADAAPDVVHGTIDALQKQYKGADAYWSTLHKGYDHAAAQGKAGDFLNNAAQTTLPPATQQQMNTPEGTVVDNGQRLVGINQKPNVAGYPQGAETFSVQKQLPPGTPVVGPRNQPGYLGPQPTQPTRGGQMYPTEASMGGAANSDIGASAQDYDREIAQSTADLVHLKDEGSRRLMQEHIDEMQRQKAAHTGGGDTGGGSFVASGPVPGANESKAGSVGVMNDHWAKINAGAADNPTAMSLLGTIRDLAPQAITGTEAGKKAYWNGLFNALHLDTKATGDVQKDTDILNKAMAQLNLATPATTDAMRTLVEAGRPHSTMSSGAIKEAAQQIEGQLKANMAVRNLLAPDKRYADATGDTSHYDEKRASLEKMMDPRIFQYESLSAEERKAFRARMNPQDRAKLADKARKLEAMGVFQ